jgi:hypothetical protein
MPHSEAVCYDRFVFAFIKGEQVADAGEPLAVTRNRLLSRGWVELDAMDPVEAKEALADVVLSPPLNIPRSCDFESSEGNGKTLYEVPSLDSDFGTIMHVETGGTDYSPPEMHPEEACGSGKLAAWYTNSYQMSILNPDFDIWNPEKMPTAEWRFEHFDGPEPRQAAPSAWALSQMGVNNMIYASKQFSGPPVLTDVEPSCVSDSLFGGGLEEGCGERMAPGEFASKCPLMPGGMLKCWYIPKEPDAPGMQELLGAHGCGGKSSDTVNSTGRETDDAKMFGSLSEVAEGMAGAGPPNPFCMSIFPPSWRLTDWYVSIQLMARGNYDPSSLLIAGIVISSLFGLVSLVSSGVWWRESLR